MGDNSAQNKPAVQPNAQKALEAIVEEPEDQPEKIDFSSLEAVHNSVAKVRVVMKSAEVNLMKDKSLFLMATVKNAGVDVDVKQIGDIKIDVSNLSIRLYNGTCWLCA